MPILVEFGIFAHMLGCNFVDALVFGFSKKTLSKFVFVEEGNSWMRTTHRDHEN